MAKHLIRSDSGHLLLSYSGHLVNEVGWIDFPLPFESYANEGGGWINPFVGDPTPNAADYATAFGDLPDGCSPGGDKVDCGYTWPFEVVTAAVLSAYGLLADGEDTSEVTRVLAAKLTITVANAVDDTWGGGGITLQVRHSDTAAPADAAIATALAWGTLAGTITIDGTTQTQTFTLALGDVDPEGAFYCAVVPDCSDNPGYPGGDQLYRRSVAVTGTLRVLDGTWIDGDWHEGGFIE